MFEERNQRVWEKIKPMGMKSYLIRSGLLRQGLIFFIALGFISPLIDHGFSAYYFQSEGFRNRLIFMGTISPLYGVLMPHGNHLKRNTINEAIVFIHIEATTKGDSSESPLCRLISKND